MLVSQISYKPVIIVLLLVKIIVCWFIGKKKKGRVIRSKNQLFPSIRTLGCPHFRIKQYFQGLFGNGVHVFLNFDFFN